MSAAFEKSGPAEQVVKTFRGTRGRDAFEAVKEGQVGHDAGYLSTSRDPSVARSLRARHDNHPVRQIRDRCQRDIDRGRRAGDPLRQGIDMRVLLSAKDGAGCDPSGLEEATLGNGAATARDCSMP